MGSGDTVDIHCKKRVRMCDIFVLVLGESYSKMVRGEYQCAIENQIPVLAFTKETSNRESNLNTFIEYLKKDLTYSSFSDLKDLRIKLRDNIIGLISERFRSFNLIYKDFLKWVSNYTVEIPKGILDKYKN